jgi:hypothetical protein
VTATDQSLGGHLASAVPRRVRYDAAGNPLPDPRFDWPTVSTRRSAVAIPCGALLGTMTSLQSFTLDGGATLSQITLSTAYNLCSALTQYPGNGRTEHWNLAFVRPGGNRAGG